MSELIAPEMQELYESKLKLPTQRLIAAFFLKNYFVLSDGWHPTHATEVKDAVGRVVGGTSYNGSIWIPTPEGKKKKELAYRRACFCLGWLEDPLNECEVELTAHERAEWQLEFTTKHPRELWPEVWRQEA